MTGVATSWMRYRGDGSTPPGQPPETRGERGRYLADPKLVTAVNTAHRGRAAAARHRRAGHRQDDAGVVDRVRAGPGAGARVPHAQRQPGARRALRLRLPAALLPRADPRRRAPSSSSRTSAGRRSAKPSGTPSQRVVLIDEIDKAPRDFPNDLLDELDRMEFRVPELGAHVQGGRIGRSSSSRATASASCPIRSCAAACSIASTFRPATGCRRFFASASAISSLSQRLIEVATGAIRAAAPDCRASRSCRRPPS